MNESSLSKFEEWAKPHGYSLEKAPAMRTENPYVDSGTWKAYEGFCAGIGAKT